MDSPGNLFCVHLSPTSNVLNVSQTLVDISDGDVQIVNKYFSACATVSLLSQSSGAIEEDLNVLQKCKAVMLVSGSENDTDSSKAFWSTISKHVNPDATRLFVLAFQNSSRDQLQALYLWGVENNIEIVDPELCAEDSISLSDRIREALDCTTWLHQQSTLQRSNDGVENEANRKFKEADVAKITDMLLALEEEAGRSERSNGDVFDDEESNTS